MSSRLKTEEIKKIVDNIVNIIITETSAGLQGAPLPSQMPASSSAGMAAKTRVSASSTPDGTGENNGASGTRKAGKIDPATAIRKMAPPIKKASDPVMGVAGNVREEEEEGVDPQYIEDKRNAIKDRENSDDKEGFPEKEL